MRHRTFLRPFQILGLVIGLAFLPVVFAPPRPPHIDHPAAAGSWVYLTDLVWTRAQAGRAVLVSEGLPGKDATFTGGTLSLGGQTYERGLGTVADSEVNYQLDGAYRHFAAVAGVDDSTWSSDGEARFFVFLDTIRVFDSGFMKRDDPPQTINVPVSGIQALRLVTVGVDALADWADARLLPAYDSIDADSDWVLHEVAAKGQELADARIQSSGDLDAVFAEEMAYLDGLGAMDTPFSPPLPVRAFSDADRLTLTNGDISVSLGIGGEAAGYLTALDLHQKRVLIHRTTSSITLASGSRYSLHDDFVPAGISEPPLRELHEPAFGEGTQAVARFQSRDGRLGLTVSLSVFRDRPAFLYQMALDRLAANEHAAFTYFDPEAGSNITVGEQATYLTDYNRLRTGALADDGLVREERVGLGKPVFLWSREDRRGLLWAAIDETPSTPYFTARLEQGQVVAQVGFGAAAASDSRGLASPRLYVESTSTTHLQDALENYRTVLARLYPTKPLPSWVRQQWLSWYVYYFEYDEAELKAQIDTIAEQLNDLGPWHILVDAGWYVAEGRPDADWRRVDPRKFPHGLRPLVDYAHSRGVKVVLYLGTPYVNTHEEAGNWMGLTGLIRAHPDWLIPQGQDDVTEHYLLDYRNPQVRRYFKNVLGDFFQRYDVDGIKVDGLASSEGEPPAGPAGPEWVLGETTNQTMAIYRFTFQQAAALRPDLYLESGWSTPVFAHPYAQTFRFGDEYPNLTNPYPMGGLFEHIDYAAYQLALGQPANMGALYGDPPDAKVLHWWLGAALALGNQISLSLPLSQMTDDALAGYRALLTHYHPFAGRTRTDGLLSPQWFATTVGSLTYLGVVNRAPDDQDFTVPLAAAGLDSEARFVAYDTETETFETVQGILQTRLPGASFRLFVLRSTPGVVWTTSGFSERADGSQLLLTLTGPRFVQGSVRVVVPGVTQVLLDGQELSLSDGQSPEPGAFFYDPETHVLTVPYPPGDVHTLAVRYSAS